MIAICKLGSETTEDFIFKLASDSLSIKRFLLYSGQAPIIDAPIITKKKCKRERQRFNKCKPKYFPNIKSTEPTAE